MNKWQRNSGVKWVYPLPLIVLGLIVSAMLYEVKELPDTARLKAFDAYLTLAPRADEGISKDIAIVDIDRASREEFGAWPWPRTRYADAIRKLKRAGAKLIVLDEVFATRDQTSPDQMLETWWNTPGVQNALDILSQLPDHDAIFSGTIRTSPIITSFRLSNEENSETPLLKGSFKLPAGSDELDIQTYQGAVPTLRPLSLASAGNGSRTFQLSSDGRTRELPLVSRLGERIYPSTILEALRLSEGVPGYELVTTSDRQGRYLSAVAIGRITVPVSPEGSLNLLPTVKKSVPHHSANELLKDRIGLNELEGRIVFLSASADEKAQLLTNGLGETYTEGEVAAEALAQILSDTYVARPAWALQVEAGTLLFFGILFIGLAFSASPLWSMLALLIGLGGMGYASYHAFSVEGLLLDAGTPIAGLLLTAIVTLVIVRMRLSAREEFVKHAFGHYLHPNAVSSLAKVSTNASYTGETRRTTVMVCGLRDMAVLEARYANHPDELTHIVNEFLSEMTVHVHETNGTINRYTGERFVATWNAPLDDEEHPKHAVECSLKMLESLDRLNHRFEEKSAYGEVPFKQIEIGIGISTGDCLTGLMGTKLHDEYSVIGDAVRSAHNNYVASETYGPAVIVAEETYVKVDHIYALLEVDFVDLPGKPHASRIFALIGNPVMKANPKFRALEEAHQAFFTSLQAQEWENALEVLENARNLSGAVPSLYDLYEKRVAYYLQNPPGEDWIGAFKPPLK